ncbi:hypothetical protein ONT17_11855 [Prevotella copri]|uniref:hypothetical protein n=1 Tax=Segatella copri TaxID=165179 RepID=UPI002232BF8E|nr:hypothetical protein [Segatella copri]MCW4119431.1 hypothetical protein [Segatella copri]
MKQMLVIMFVLASIDVNAQGNDTVNVEKEIAPIDTTLHLNDVVIKAARVIHKVDRDIILPNAKIKENSSNGYDLLRKLHLPNLKVNEAQQSISSYLGGVQVRINDIKATVQDILALQPNDVTRIEYIDDPGVRYGDANLAVVINYVVKKRYVGYVGGVNTTQALWERFNNSNAFFRYNYKKSEFGLSYRLNYRWYDKRRQDSHAVYLQPDGLERTVDYVGQDAEMTYNSHNLQLSYNLSDPGKYSLNVRFGLDWMNSPYNKKLQKVFETGRQDLLLFTNDFGHVRNPVLDIYYSLNLPKKQSLVINVVGTHLGSDNIHRQNEYVLQNDVDETLSSSPLHDYGYEADGSKYSLITEAIYTKLLNKVLSFSGGTNYAVSRTDNKYTGSQNVTTVLNSNNVYLFSQLDGRLSKIANFQLGLGANYISIVQGNVGFHKWTFRPKLTLASNSIKNFRIRLTGSINPQVPSLSQLSEVRQQGSTMQADDGNSTLKATSTYNGALGFTWNNKIVDVYWGGNMSYTPDAIMTSILPQQQADGSYLYVWKPENQKSFTSYFAYTTLVFHVIPDIFDIQGELQYQHLRSRGLDYSHDFEPLHYGLTASLNLKKWYVEYYFANAWEQLSGESRRAGEKQSTLTVSYKHKNLRLGLSCLLLGYPQGFDYKNRTNSKYYVSRGVTYIKNNGNMLMFTLGYTFSHGRKYKTDRRKLNNSDKETGLRI